VRRDDEGLSEVVDSTLIIALGLVLTGIIAAFVFGVFSPVDKTAYLVPRFSITNISDHSVIVVFHSGGEPVYLNGPPLVKYRADLYVDTQSGSYKAVPVPAVTVFKPGDTLYAYSTGSGFILTDTFSGATVSSLPAGRITVRFVDVTSGVLISKEDLVKGTAPVTIATTAPTGTTEPTGTTTTTATTASPTPKITCPPYNPNCNKCPGPWPWC